MRDLGTLHWEMFLRGAVAALLAAHVLVLLLPGPRPAVRRVLAGFAASVLAYLFCQQAELLLNLPRALAVGLLAFAVGSTGWLWAAARALFVDGFRADVRVLGPVAALTALGLAANLPYFPTGDGPYRSFAPDAPVVWFGRLASGGDARLHGGGAVGGAGRGGGRPGRGPALGAALGGARHRPVRGLRAGGGTGAARSGRSARCCRRCTWRASG